MYLLLFKNNFKGESLSYYKPLKSYSNPSNSPMKYDSYGCTTLRIVTDFIEILKLSGTVTA